MERLVREELERWDSEAAVSRPGSSMSRPGTSMSRPGTGRPGTGRPGTGAR